MTDEEKVDALLLEGGWAATHDWLYAMYPPPRLELPEFSVSRGGIDYTDHRTDAEKAAAEAVQALIHRKIGDIRKAQIAVINTAWAEAAAMGVDIHIQYHPWKTTRFVGVSFEPRTSGLDFASVHEHPDDFYWENDDD